MLVALAGRQHGVLERGQLIRIGLSRRAIDTMVEEGRLLRIHRGVYAVGHRLLTAKGRWMAAVLAVERSVLSHRSAAALWELLPNAGRNPEVTVAGRRGSRPAIRVHSTRFLPPAETTEIDGIPCTSLARTLCDIAPLVPPRRLERAVGQAEVRGLFDLRAVEAILGREPRRRGKAALLSVLGRSDLGTTETWSPLEEILINLCDRFGTERPEFNVPFTLPDGTAIRIDAFWRRARLAVEVDGERHHSTPRDRAGDRRRDAQLTAAGLRPLRLGRQELVQEPEATARLLASLVAAVPGGNRPEPA